MWRLRAWDLCASDVLSRWLLPRTLFVEFAMYRRAASSLRPIGCSKKVAGTCHVTTWGFPYLCSVLVS